MEPVIEVLTPAERPEQARVRARAQVKVVMYTTKWCGACKVARNYLQQQGIAFEEHDVERELTARARYRALSPSGAVPTIEVDGQVMRGFSARTFEALLEKATQDRVARHECGGPKTFEVHWHDRTR